jgi:acetyl-CoA synthetase
MNVSGHLLSTAEIESALVAHPQVVEAAVVAAPVSFSLQIWCKLLLHKFIDAIYFYCL